MNENIDLTKILNGCPKGWKFYSTIFGEVEFDKIKEDDEYPIVFVTIQDSKFDTTEDGRHHKQYDGECTIFPSKEQRDWSKFTAPWYKKLIEHKFHVGQYVTDGYVGGQITSIEDNYHCYKILDFMGGIDTTIPFTLQDNYHLWNIQDAKDGDVIRFGTVTAIFKKYIGQEKCICYCSFCKDGGFEIPIENGDDNVYGCYNTTPATKEQRDALMKSMNDAGYEWDAKKKELNKKEKFDPKTLQPFDRVLARIDGGNAYCWFADFVSTPTIEKYDLLPCIMSNKDANMIITYNDDTKHLVGTNEEAPDFYKYWED